MQEPIFQWISGAALAVTTAVGAWLVRVGTKQNRHAQQIAVLEQTMRDMPKLIREIRDELRLMREDGTKRQQQLYDRIEAVRLELKEDLRGKQDKG